MDNFQLYRTNVLLGGNMKYDLILDNDSDSNLYVSNFYITPISDRLPYNRYSDDNLLNYSHQENIKSYYQKIQGSFYNEYIDPQLTHNWPLIEEADKPYDDTFFMGCKRAQYQLYNKQLSFFVPLWLESVSDKDDIEFNIEVYSVKDKDDTQVKLGEKRIIITQKEFGEYIKNYIKYLGICDGDDKVMKIDFRNNYSVISGLEVSSGNVVTKEIGSLVDNLLYRERPLLETDSILINSFVNNKLIVKQLFNFNLCFNLNDILTPFIGNKLFDQKVNIKVFTKIGGKELELKDFYSNYNDLKKELYIVKSLSTVLNNDPLEDVQDNYVLDYLKDDKCVDLIDKNTISQKYIHWSLNDNPNYIFNLYEGFSGNVYFQEDKKYYYCTHYNGLAGDLKTLSSNNFFPWINTITVNEDEKYIIKDLLINIYNYKDIMSPLGSFINNIKYKYKEEYKEGIENLSVLFIKVSNNILSEISKIYKNFNGLRTISSDPDGLFILYSTNNIFIFSDKYENFGMKRLVDLLPEKSIENTPLKYFITFIQSSIEPQVIVFNRGLKTHLADSPSKSSKEIEYYKNDDMYCYLMRYDGHIKPTFIDKGNVLYHKLIYSKIKKFNIYNNYKFPPTYPSIGYFSFDKNELDYDKYINLNQLVEYKWFNNGISYYLKPIINLSGKYNDSNILDDIDGYFEDNYGATAAGYIKSLYDISYDLKDINVETIDDKINTVYNFDIQLNLK